MSIQSTRTITRESAIERIGRVALLVEGGYYRILEEITSEPDYNLTGCLHEGVDFERTNLRNWTNTMLEEVMDKPFYRYSLFENYNVEDRPS